MTLDQQGHVIDFLFPAPGADAAVKVPVLAGTALERGVIPIDGDAADGEVSPIGDLFFLLGFRGGGGFPGLLSVTGLRSRFLLRG